MKVLIVKPGVQMPLVQEIQPDLASLQAEVGGYIEAIYPFDDPVAVIVNEDGKINGMPLNRALYGPDGGIYDVIVGTFLIVGLAEDSFTSIPDSLIEKYQRMFSNY